MFNSSKQVSSLRKLLTSYSTIINRQTVFASASIPQHRHFLHDCIQQKWTKVADISMLFSFGFMLSGVLKYDIDIYTLQRDVVHVHVNAIEPMPTCIVHRFVVQFSIIQNSLMC